MKLNQKIDSAISKIRRKPVVMHASGKPAQDAAGQSPSDFLDFRGEMPVRRILYFQSQIDDIIDWSIDNSDKLRKLMSALPCCEKVISAQDLRSSGFLRDFSHYLNSRGELTAVKFSEGMYAPPFLCLKDFHIYGDSENQSMLLSGFLRNPAFDYSVLLISSPVALIPMGFEDRVELIIAPQIDQEDIAALIMKIHREKCEGFLSPELLRADDPRMDALTRRFKGLSARQIEDVLHRVFIACDKVCELDTRLSPAESAEVSKLTDHFIWEVKENISLKDGSMTYIKVTEDATAVGMDVYEKWIKSRSTSFRECYPDAPRGVMFVGIPGTGKTLMAKRTAQLLSCELVAFNLSMVKNSLYGSSGQLLDAKLNLFESQGSLVVLVDEAEKDLPSTENQNVHETTSALLGRLLTWMNDHKSSVFLMFTSNDISHTNQELFRPGRIDRVFFVGMPWRDELAAILQSNLIDMEQKWNDRGRDFMKRKLVAELRDCQRSGSTHACCTEIVDALGGLIQSEKRNLFFTGADIAHLIKEASTLLTTAMDKQFPIGPDDLRDAMCAVAKGQPFATGERILSTVVRLYLQCAINNYALVSSRSDLVDLAVSLRKGEEPSAPEYDNDYDRALYQCISTEILKARKILSE